MKFKKFNVSNSNPNGLFTCSRGTRLTKLERKPGNIPLLTAGVGEGHATLFFLFWNHYTTHYSICKGVFEIIFLFSELFFKLFLQKLLTSSAFGAIIASQERYFDLFRNRSFLFKKDFSRRLQKPCVDPFLKGRYRYERLLSEEQQNHTRYRYNIVPRGQHW